MVWPRALEGLGLVLVVGFVVAVAYLPHADSFSTPPSSESGLLGLAEVYWAWQVQHVRDDYPYPIHVDENVHWEAMASAARADSLRHEGVFFALPEDATPLSLRGLVHERGFHVAVLTFQEMTGVDWLDLFRFLPSLWLGLTAVLVWAALRPWPGALVAAALVALTPTSARFLGPALLVPMAFGLAWLAAALMLLPHAVRRERTGGLLVVLMAWAFFIHLSAGLAVLLVALCGLPFARGHRRGMALLAAMTLLPVLALSQAFSGDIQNELDRTDALLNDLTIFDQVGVAFLVLWPIGCALMALRPPAVARLPMLAAAGASLVVMAGIALNLALDIEVYALYDRWHQPFTVLAAIPTAYALWMLPALALEGAERVRARFSWRRPVRAGHALALTAVMCVAGAAAAIDLPVRYHLAEPYYHVLDDNDWRAFASAVANANDTYEVFLAHPWKGVVFAALSGKEPRTYLAPGTPPVRGEDWDAYVNGAHRDGAWLVERDVSLVVWGQGPTGGEFEGTAFWTWQLNWVQAQELAALRAEASR